MASGAVTLLISRGMRIRITCRPRRAAGFTLIELIVTMMIIAILAAIAIPNYLQYLSRGHRSEARATLTQTAQWMERWRTERNTYQTSPQNANPPALPQSLQSSPPPPSPPIYNITVVTPTPAQYTLSATPVNPGPMGNDACGVLTLDNTGLRTRTGPADFNLCWGR